MNRAIIIFLIGALATPCLGQYFDKYFGLVYDANKPLSNTEFIKNISRRGAKLIYREFINEKFCIGGEVGFATYNDYVPPAVYTSDNVSIYTDIYGYVYNYTISLSGEYFFMTGKVMPYVGFGLGAARNKFSAYYNVFENHEIKWGALIRPNVGALLRFGKKTSWGATAGLHLDYSTTKSVDFDYRNFSNIGFQVGLVYMNW